MSALNDIVLLRNKVFVRISMEQSSKNISCLQLLLQRVLLVDIFITISVLPRSFGLAVLPDESCKL